MANVADLNLIQINNFPEVESPSEWIVVSDAEGTAYKISKENFKAFLGTVTVSTPKPIGPSDATPEQDGVYIPTVVGVYPNFGGLERLESDGYVQFIKNGSVYAKVNTPMPDLSGLASKQSVEAVKYSLDSLTDASPNLLDKSKITSGNYVLSNGNKVASNNWISIEMDVEPSTQYTLSGYRGFDAVNPRMFFMKSDNTAEQSKTIMGGGASIETPITFTTSAETSKIRINIASLANIGLTPTDNTWANKVQVEKGNVATSYMPYGAATLKNVKSEILPADKNPVNSVAVVDFVNESIENKIGAFIKTSPNILDKSKIESGYYTLNSGSKVASDNWISIEVDVEPSQEYTLSGHRQVPINIAKIFFVKNDGTADQSKTILGDGTTAETPLTFTTTAETKRVKINIAQFSNIGLTPTNNEWANKVQLEKGNIATKYMAYGEAYLDIDIPDFPDIPDATTWINDPRTPYPPTLSGVEIRSVNEASVCWVDRFGRVFGKSGKQFYHSTDSAQTWTLIKDFGSDAQNIETCRDLEDGEIIIITQKRTNPTPKNCCVLKSTGWNNGNPTGEVTFAEVFETASRGDINNHWGTHVYKHKVFLSEYGNRGEALKAYLSNDYGSTFSVAFDFSDYADDVVNAHIHGSCIDPYRGWLWIVTGDVTNSATYYSKDDAATWITLEDINIKAGTAPHQQVTVFPMPDSVVFLTDRTDLNATPPLVSGAYRININSENADNLKASDIKLAYRVDYSSFLVQMGANAFKNYYNGQQPTYFAFKRTASGAGEDVSCGIFATFDGRNIFKVFESPILPLQGGFKMVYGPDMNGKILANYDLSATEARLFVADASEFY